jgi:hypothetical protein
VQEAGASGAEAAAKAKSNVPVAKLRGLAEDFYAEKNYMGLIVKSSVERTGQALQELFKVKEWRKDTKNAPVDLSGRFALLCQLRGHDWTIVIGGGEWSGLIPQSKETIGRGIVGATGAKMLSEKLNAKAVFAGTEHVSGAFYYEIYESGNLREMFDRAPDFPTRFKSDLRRVDQQEFAKQNFDERGFLNKILIPDGAYLPVAGIDEGAKVIVFDVEPKDFARVDFLSFR